MLKSQDRRPRNGWPLLLSPGQVSEREAPEIELLTIPCISLPGDLECLHILLLCNGASDLIYGRWIAWTMQTLENKYSIKASLLMSLR